MLLKLITQIYTHVFMFFMCPYRLQRQWLVLSLHMYQFLHGFWVQVSGTGHGPPTHILFQLEQVGSVFHSPYMANWKCRNVTLSLNNNNKRIGTTSPKCMLEKHIYHNNRKIKSPLLLLFKFNVTFRQLSIGHIATRKVWW